MCLHYTSIMRYWEDLVGDNYYICIDDVEEVKERSPVIYERMQDQGIRRMTLMLTRVNGVLQGVIGYDNPTLPIESLRAFSENVFLFINLAMDKNEQERRLNFVTYHDCLTGLMNRSSFRRDVASLDETGIKNAGILYVDLNGLKEINDHQSHTAGDRMLVRCAEALRALCSTNMLTAWAATNL